MAKIDKKKLGQVIDTCIEASARLEKMEFVVKGLRGDIEKLHTEIDEVSTTLFFHYKGDAK